MLAIAPQQYTSTCFAGIILHSCTRDSPESHRMQSRSTSNLTHFFLPPRTSPQQQPTGLQPPATTTMVPPQPLPLSSSAHTLGVPTKAGADRARALPPVSGSSRPTTPSVCVTHGPASIAWSPLLGQSRVPRSWVCSRLCTCALATLDVFLRLRIFFALRWLCGAPVRIKPTV